MIALLLGTAIAVAALAFVLAPLVHEPLVHEPRARGGAAAPAPPDAGARDPDETSSSAAVDALREIEFDRATGKLSDDDYAELKSAYTRRALAEMRAHAAVATAGGSAPDRAELAVLAFRARRTSCPEHGPRPEADATYCSDCGRYLQGACGGCRAEIREVGARFCSSCGARLAA